MINTGKLAANSSSIIKSLKENDTNNKISKIDDKKDKNLSKKLLKDFPDININNKAFKSRLIGLNNSLSKYENELSKTQFIEKKIKFIETLFLKNEQEQIKQIINDSVYNNEKVLKNYFNIENNIKKQIQDVKKLIGNKYSQLHKEFNAIQITSQNIFSLYSYPMNVTEDSIKNLNLYDLFKSTRLSSKRVMDLIS